MKGNAMPMRSSEFLLPELQLIGDAVCQMLTLGVEEELLGPSILARVQPLIAKGRVTSSDVVRLALLIDALSVAETAITEDGSISDAEVSYALALVQAVARRLCAFREFYADFCDARQEHVREFVETHRSDVQLFGGGCGDTRWLGLEIVRRVAQETGDREALDRYSELMLRLSEEIVALEGGRAPGDRVRQELENALGLRELLAQAQEEAPEDSQDPRVRVFCSPETPEVFHSIAHANQVWRADPFDVEIVHQETRVLFQRLLDRAAEQSDDGAGKALLVLGEAGSGKTHLMRAFRERAHGQRLGYAGYMQMSAAPDDYARYVLIHLLESLEKPYDAPGVSDAGLGCLSDALVVAPVSITPHQRRRLREEEMSDDALCTLVFDLADAVVRDPRFTDVDIDLIRALLFLQRGEPALYARVLKFLRCEPLSSRDLVKLGELSPKVQSDDPLRVIVHLGKIIARVGGGALVLMLDQLEDMYDQPNAKERFIRSMNVVRHVVDHVPNALVVVSCLRDFYVEMKQHLTRTVLDRLERNPEPQQLMVGRNIQEIEAIVERRLGHLYEISGVRARADQPYFPFTRSTLETLAGLSARDALRELHDLQMRSIAAGAVVDGGGLGVSPPQVSIKPVDPGWSQRWNDFCATRTVSLEVPDEDVSLLGVLLQSLESLHDELPLGVSVRASARSGGISLSLGEPSGGSVTCLIQLTNKSHRGGGLSRQLDALLKAAAEARSVPVALRSSDFGGGAGSAVAKHLGALFKAHGRKVVVDNASWRTMMAYRAFWLQHRGEPGFVDWARSERPLLTGDAIRGILGLPAVIDVRGSDMFVQAVGSVVRPKPSRPPQPSTPAHHVAGTELASVPPRVTNKAPDTHNGPLRLGVTISVKAAAATLDPEQLKRHAAFLGASGSGKTSLALNVIEQLVERGVGAILLDRKGDLAVYADPELRGMPDADAERARRKRALFEQAHVRLFTPGNPAGQSLRIRAVPAGLSALPPHERAQICQFAAQGLGAMMGYKGTGTELTHLAILAKAIDVLAQLNADREVGLREIIELLAEEDESLIAELGRLDPKLFGRLVTNLETLRLTHGALLESDNEPLRAEALLGRDGSTSKGRVPITIISTKFLGDAERVDFWVSQLLVELSRWCSRSPSKSLQSVLFLDEADMYMPATRKPATKEPLQDLLKRARSAGLGVMLATQNPGDLDYKGRDNIGTWWLGRISSKTAIEKMKPLLSECRTDVSSSLATAAVGEFFQISNGNVLRMRSEQALMDTVQLADDHILQLAGAHVDVRKLG